MFKRYRKKPVVVGAIQFILPDAYNHPISKDFKFCDNWKVKKDVFGFFLLIETLEGTMRANYLDWIIEGVNGEFYPCKPDIFKKTYEEVK